MKIKLENEQATEQFAEDLSLCLRAGDLLALSGDLGAGKSTLARALIRALADDAALEVPSPTFTLVQLYEETRFAVAHADIYRLQDPAELEELGLEEARQNGIAVVEWAEKAPHLLENAQFHLYLSEEADGSRILAIRAAAEAQARLKHSLGIRAFLRENGRGSAKRRYLQGDASPRRYEKLYLSAPESAAASAAEGSAAPHKTEILMDAPLLEIQDESRADYIRRARLAAHNRQFTACAALLQAQGFQAPQIYAENTAETLFLLEDLGSEGIADAKGSLNPQRAQAAAEFLAVFHQTDWPQAAHKSGFNLPLYDTQALQAEADLFAEWYVPYKTGAPAGTAWLSRWRELWAPLFAELAAGERCLALRDFHSPNILWQPHRHGVKRIGLIDFQDAALGSPAYDLVSLTQDARLDVSPLLEQKLKADYFTARAALEKPFDPAECEAAYAILGAQRACKILGVFVRLAKRDGKSRYMHHLPRIAEYLRRNLDFAGLMDMRAFLAASGALA